MLSAKCYIPNVLSLLRLHRRFFLGIALAGLALRLFFFVYFPAVTDDSRIYADFATNWLQHGIYGTTQSGEIVPSDTRLPGYPGFLAAIFALFGAGSFRAVLVVQILVDLGTCFLVADLARRTVSDRGARIAFVLAALCPFLANYAAAVLTETLEVFFTALALDCAIAGFDHLNQGRGHWRAWAGSGLSIAACILLRPDGGLVLVAVGLYLTLLGWKRWREQSSPVPAVKAAVLVGLLALAPLAPWTLRNFRTFHHFQSLAPRYATEQDELAPRGFNRWVATWIVDYASVEEIYWNVPGDTIDPDKLPSRAFDSPPQRDVTLAVIDDYNQSPSLTPELDARFGELAAQRVGEHPVRYYVVLPALRIADMWLRPRTEILPPDPRWWEFDDEPKGSIIAVGFGSLNLAYVGAALLALIGKSSTARFAGLLVGFAVLRSAFLGTLENPEPRYTLECYPVVILFAARLAADRRSRSEPRVPQSSG
jgi:4-amino-4-deoxy-L-arabinose transferase-like glycosyltransferase